MRDRSKFSISQQRSATAHHLSLLREMQHSRLGLQGLLNSHNASAQPNKAMQKSCRRPMHSVVVLEMDYTSGSKRKQCTLLGKATNAT